MDPDFDTKVVFQMAIHSQDQVYAVHEPAQSSLNQHVLHYDCIMYGVGIFFPALGPSLQIHFIWF